MLCVNVGLAKRVSRWTFVDSFLKSRSKCLRSSLHLSERCGRQFQGSETSEIKTAPTLPTPTARCVNPCNVFFCAPRRGGVFRLRGCLPRRAFSALLELNRGCFREQRSGVTFLLLQTCPLRRSGRSRVGRLIQLCFSVLYVFCRLINVINASAQDELFTLEPGVSSRS